MRTYIFSLLAIALFFASCSDRSANPCVSIQEDVPLETKLGECYDLEGSDLSFEYVSILDDRCPLDAVCVWEGTVIGTIKITGPSVDVEGEIWSNYGVSTDMGFVEVGDYTFYLDNVQNALTNSNDPIDPEDFRLDVLITKN